MIFYRPKLHAARIFQCIRFQTTSDKYILCKPYRLSALTCNIFFTQQVTTQQGKPRLCLECSLAVDKSEHSRAPFNIRNYVPPATLHGTLVNS